MKLFGDPDTEDYEPPAPAKDRADLAKLKELREHPDFPEWLQDLREWAYDDAGTPSGLLLKLLDPKT